MWASLEGHIAVMEALLDAGADPKAADNEGETALAKANRNMETGAVSLLRARLEPRRRV